MLNGLNIGFAVTGSFCTFAEILPVMEGLRDMGVQLQPIFSYHVSELDTRFFAAADFRRQVEAICEKPVWDTLPQTEPIGPRHLLDAVVIAPCTGNSLAKLALGITDTPPLMAAKSQLRNGGPVVVAPATNDALSNSAKNIGALMNCKGIYMTPLAQDDPLRKPTSVIARMDLIPQTLELALSGIQIQPILRGWEGEIP